MLRQFNKKMSGLLLPLLSPLSLLGKKASMMSVLLLGVSMVMGSAAWAKAPKTGVPMSLQALSERVYIVQGEAGIATDNAGFISNAGVILTGDGVIVIDALGTPALAEQLVGEIKKITDQPIKAVIVTHYHADHFYGLQVFEALGAEIIAPPGAQDYLLSDTAEIRLMERRESLKPWVNADTRMVQPDREIETSETLQMGKVTLELINLGTAHSEGDLTVLLSPDQVLFTGDIIFEGRIPYIGNGDTRNWLAALDKLRSESVHAIVPGHGAPAEKPAELIENTYQYLKFLRESMAAAVDEFMPFSEAYEAVDWSGFWAYPAFLEANRGNAYGVYLSLEREALE